MMELLKRFAVLTLVTGTLLSLLPDGSLRRTASMASGLMMLLFWAEGVSELLNAVGAFALPDAPLSPLTTTGTDAEAAAAGAAGILQHLWEGRP